jgi:hypothetical protein
VEEENPVEKAGEDVHHEGVHAREPWVAWVALTTALLAGLAALASSMSSHHESEGILEQIKASDNWGWYQAKGIKRDILKMSRPDAPDIKRYEGEQEKLQRDAEEQQAASLRHIRLHKIYANSVMFLQIAIATAAITVLMRRPAFWFVSLGFGIAGLAFLIYGLIAK